jgi:hypothetical protein
LFEMAASSWRDSPAASPAGMNVIGQQAVAEKRDFFQLIRNQLIQVPLAVAIIFENVLAIVPRAHDYEEAG